MPGCGREQSRLSEFSIRSISPSIMLRLGDFRSSAGGLSSYAFGRLMDFPLTHESSVVICSIICGKSSATPCPHFFVLFAFGVLVSFFYFCYVKNSNTFLTFSEYCVFGMSFSTDGALRSEIVKVLDRLKAQNLCLLEAKVTFLFSQHLDLL